MSAYLTPAEFAKKWDGNTRTERAASQEHFIDLCRMLGVPTPNEADPTGDEYAFEKGAEKTAGGDGFADVWKRGHFAWEYKGKHKDLKAAYQQLLQYREALENPPLLVVCDLDRFEIHTNFTNTPAIVHAFDLERLLTDPSEPLRLLRAVMQHPEELRPGKTRDELTAEAAKQFASLAERLEGRGHDPHDVAHFLNKLLFCMFAEDAGLLPTRLLRRLAAAAPQRPLGLHRRPARPLREDVRQGRPVRRRTHRLVQRRALRQRRGAAADGRRDRDGRSGRHGSTGRRSSRPSSARSSSAGSTRASAPSSARTTPIAPPSCVSSSRCC